MSGADTSSIYLGTQWDHLPGIILQAGLRSQGCPLFPRARPGCPACGDHASEREVSFLRMSALLSWLPRHRMLDRNASTGRAFVAELSASEGEWCNRERGWAPDHSKAVDSQRLGWTLSTPTSWYKGTAFYPLRSAKFSENVNIPSSCAPGDRMVAHLWTISFSVCAKLLTCQCGGPLSTPAVFSELLIMAANSNCS